MEIEKFGSGPWPGVSVSGVTVTLTACGETRAYDCAALQGDAQVVVDVVRGEDGRLAEGVAGGGEYVANLIIPPARYEDVAAAEGTAAEDVETGAERARVTLDAAGMAAVRLILWTINDTQEA